MATIYGKGRGKAGSHAPRAEKPYWLKLKPAEIEKIVIDLAKKGLPSPKIGLILRDSYGVPSIKAVVGKKIEQIMTEHGIKPERHELAALEKRAKALKKHLEKNHKDMRAKRGLQLTESKFRRLKQHHARKKKIK
ncbi:MAG: 30S ribosomal protein S15 [Candidatus Aminicenantales bacterium]